MFGASLAKVNVEKKMLDKNGDIEGGHALQENTIDPLYNTMTVVWNCLIERHVDKLNTRWNWKFSLEKETKVRTRGSRIDAQLSSCDQRLVTRNWGAHKHTHTHTQSRASRLIHDFGISGDANRRKQYISFEGRRLFITMKSWSGKNYPQRQQDHWTRRLCEDVWYGRGPRRPVDFWRSLLICERLIACPCKKSWKSVNFRIIVLHSNILAVFVVQSGIAIPLGQFEGTY